MSEQTAVTTEVFDEWFKAMCERVAMVSNAADHHKVPLIVGAVWASLLGQDAAEQRGDEAAAGKCAGLAELLWSDAVRSQCSAWLDWQSDVMARKDLMHQQPNFAMLCQKIDQLQAAMYAPVRLAHDAAGNRVALRDPPRLQLKAVSPRVKFIPRSAFQLVGVHTIAVPHVRDGEECALVANFDDGSIWIRTLPDTTPDHGRPVHFLYPA